MSKYRILIMSVGEYAKNYTARYLAKIDGVDKSTIVLPSVFESNAESYKKHGFDVYIYDEKKYINGEFEFFGLKPRNCGGVGRQGVAECIEHFGKDYDGYYVLDDDYSALFVRKYDVKTEKWKQTSIDSNDDLLDVIGGLDNFCKKTGILAGGSTANIIPSRGSSGKNFTSYKLFNNFLMYSGRKANFDGFKALTNDDYRYNMFLNYQQNIPLMSLLRLSISSVNSQGVRKDGNAVIYNTDLSWKKAYALKLMSPASASLYLKKVKTNNMWQFKEKHNYKLVGPPILLRDDETGKIDRVVVFNKKENIL